MAWSTRELEYLCDHYRVDQSLGEIAQALGRTYEGVKSTVARLGLAVSRRWPAADVKALRTQYGRRATAAIAAELGRSVRCVYDQATRLGLSRKVPPYGEREWAIIRRLAGEGACNSCIARALGRAQANNAKHQVACWRRKLGLPAVGVHGSVDSCQTCKARTRETTRRQLATAGVQSMGELRVVAFRRYAARHGWPEDLRPRAVQMLEVLFAAGLPMSRRQLAAAIGMPWKGTRKSLVSNDPEGSYLAHLMKRGLVVRSSHRLALGKGKGRGIYLYELSNDAKQRRMIHEQANAAG